MLKKFFSVFFDDLDKKNNEENLDLFEDDYDNYSEVEPVMNFVVDFSKLNVVSISYVNDYITICYIRQDGSLATHSMKMIDISQYQNLVEQYYKWVEKNVTIDDPNTP